MARLVFLLACLACTAIPGCNDTPKNEVSFHGEGGGTQSGWVKCPDGEVDLGVAIKGESGSILVTVDVEADLGGSGATLHEERTFLPTFSMQTSSEHFAGFDRDATVYFNVVRTQDWQGRYTVTLDC